MVVVGKPVGKPQQRRTNRRRPRMTLEQRMKKIALSNQETKLKTWELLNNQNTRGVGLQFGTITARKGAYVEDVLASSVMNMTQGVSQQQMIGNKITDCKLNIKGFININPASAVSNSSPYPFEVHLLVYKRKDSAANNPDKLMQYPNNTNGVLTGDAGTSMLSFNREGYTIKKHRIFKMRAGPNVATSTIPNAVGLENPSFNAGDYQFFKRFSMNIPINKTLLFDDSTLSPKNEWCCFAVYIINGDGQTLLNVQQRANVTAIATMRYKDA